MVTSHERSVELAAPVAQVFEAVRDPAGYPRFLRGIAEVRAPGDGSLQFRTDGPDARWWPAAVTEMVDDVSVGWTSREAPVHTGLITLEPVTAETTRVVLRIDSDPGATPGGDPTADLGRLAEMVGALPEAPPEPRLVSLAAILDVTVTDALGEPVGSVRDAHIDVDGLRTQAPSTAPTWCRSNPLASTTRSGASPCPTRLRRSDRRPASSPAPSQARRSSPRPPPCSRRPPPVRSPARPNAPRCR